jgi:trk system potassium uptake protein TrkA
MANRVARGIISPNILEYLPISEDYTIAELAPPAAFIGKSLAELDLRKKYNLQVIAIRDVLTGRMQLVPRASSVLKDSDVLVIIGREEDIQKVK